MKNILLRVRILLILLDKQLCKTSGRGRHHSYTWLQVSFPHLTRSCLGVWRIKGDVIGSSSPTLSGLKSSCPPSPSHPSSRQALSLSRSSSWMIPNSEVEQGQVAPFQPFTSHYCAGLIPSHLTDKQNWMQEFRSQLQD